jgi:hypothetical protein
VGGIEISASTMDGQGAFGGGSPPDCNGNRAPTATELWGRVSDSEIRMQRILCRLIIQAILKVFDCTFLLLCIAIKDIIC